MSDDNDNRVERPAIPEGSYINGEILVTSYFDHDGQMMYATNMAGSLNIAQALGLLVLGGILLFKGYKAQEEE